MAEDKPTNPIATLAQRLHSKSLAPTPRLEDYEAAVRELQRVPTAAEARDFRAVWADDHAAWTALTGQANTPNARSGGEDMLEAALRGEYEHIGGDLPWPAFRLRQGAAVLRALARDADDVAEPILAADIAAVAERVEQAASAEDALGRKQREKAAHVLDVVERWARDHRDGETGEVSQVEIDTIGKLALDAAGYTIAIAPMDARREKADTLLGYVEQWCEEHEVGPYNDFPERLRRMLATELLHFAVGVCRLALPQVFVGVDPPGQEKGDGAAAVGVVQSASTPFSVQSWGSIDDLRHSGFAGAPPTPTPPLPYWSNESHIMVGGSDLLVRDEHGKLDYRLLTAAMTDVAAWTIPDEVRSTFHTLVSNAVAYEESRGVPLTHSTKPTDGNVLLAYNRCATAMRGDVSRIALLVELRLAGIGADLKERRDYMEDMIKRGLLSLTNGADPLHLGSHPAAAPGSAAS